MKLRELGEDRLVARLIRGLPLRKEVLVGAGDDCAVIRCANGADWLLLKTDAVIEGVHFLPEEKMERVGWKALCRAISDIAAMGGEPWHALITVAAGAEVEVARLEALYRGLRKAARRFGVAIVGGETARSPGPLFVSVALTGSVEPRRGVLRSGGRAGDAVYVTGRLGGSRAGKHLDFVPRLAEARWLTANAKLHAMMDVSDGVGADLPRLAAACGCGCELWREALPRTKGCTVEQALGDGEDFELLFALPVRAGLALEAEWRQRFPRLALTRIGTLTKSGGAKTKGYDHFA